MTARFDDLPHRVTLRFFTQTIGAPATALLTRQILDDLVAASPRVAIEEYNLVLDRAIAADHGIDRIPATVLLRDGVDARIRFLGAPEGYERQALIEAIVLTGSGDSGLSASSRALLAAHVTAPLTISVFVTPTCRYCPQMITLANRMAVENPHISTTCIEAAEFMDLSTRYRVTGVPKTVINGSAEVLGAVTEDEFLRHVVEAVRPAGDCPPDDTSSGRRGPI